MDTRAERNDSLPYSWGSVQSRIEGVGDRIFECYWAESIAFIDVTIGSGFGEKKETPLPLMKRSVQLHMARLSLSDPVFIPARFDVERTRSTVHNEVQIANLPPTPEANPGHVVVDETAIYLDNQQYCPFEAVDPETSEFLLVSPFPRGNGWTIQPFRELYQCHDVADTTFLVDNSCMLQNTVDRLGYEFSHETRGRRNSVERVLKETKRRINQFAIIFIIARHTTAETRLTTVAM